MGKVLFDVASRLHEGELPTIEPVLVTSQYSVSVRLATTSDIFPSGEDIGVLRDRYREWLTAILEVFVQCEPQRPYERLVGAVLLGG